MSNRLHFGRTNRNVVGRFLFKLLLLRGSLFEIDYLLSFFTYFRLKNLSRHKVRPKLRFR